ncbi:MAG TPA: hypothetical protein VMF55_05950, partial [Solirubrobacterales bacterium]|nr:hypothetical protein [Solirubrobacterales bacterium]
IPAWSEARAELPFVFAASAAASAAGAAMLTVPSAEAEPARALGVAAVVVEEAASKVMLRRLGPLASAYEEGTAGRLDKAARALAALGALTLAASGPRGPLPARHRRPVSAGAGALLLAGAACKRWAVFKAGFASAADPHQTIDLQRARR